MSDIVFGGDCRVEVKIEGVYYEVGCGTGFEFTPENEVVYKTDVNAGFGRKVRVRQTDSTAVINDVVKTSNVGNISAFYFMQESVRRSYLDFRLIFIDQDEAIKVITFNAIIESMNIRSDISNFVECDINLHVNGDYQVSSISAPDIEECMTVDSDYWNTTEGEITISGSSVNGLSLVGKDVLSVHREGLEYDIIVGSPSGRQCSFSSALGRITFDSSLPFNSGETVFVVWQY